MSAKMYWGAQDGGGTGQEDHFLPNIFIKRSFECWTTSTKQPLNAGGGYQAPRKAVYLFSSKGGMWLLASLLSPILALAFLPRSSLSPSSPSSYLLNSENPSGCSRLWKTLRELITGKISLSSFDSPSSPPGYLYLPPPSSVLCVTVDLSQCPLLWRTVSLLT